MSNTIVPSPVELSPPLMFPVATMRSTYVNIIVAYNLKTQGTHMSQTVLPQLQEVIADLQAQETALSTQLTDVQTKLEGIRAVLPMFEGDNTALLATDDNAKAPAAVEKKEVIKKPTTKAKAKASKKSTPTAKTAAKAKTSKESKPAPKAVAKAKTSKESKPAPKAVAKIKATGKKKDGRAATWQKYTLTGVGDRPMPEAVQLILATQPEKDFKIVEVMSALFKEDMPKSQYLKARNRISNILSGGVRDGEWFKGDRGAYRLSKPA